MNIGSCALSRNTTSNILDNLAKEEFRVFRKRLVEMILATDMANHTKVMNSLKSKLDSFDTKVEKSKVKNSPALLHLLQCYAIRCKLVHNTSIYAIFQPS